MKNSGTKSAVSPKLAELLVKIYVAWVSHLETLKVTSQLVKSLQAAIRVEN
jgi:hypothetical protein